MSLAWNASKELGVSYLPQHWKIRRIGDLVYLSNGYPFSSEHFSPKGEIPLVRIRDLASPTFETYIDAKIPPASMIRDGDIIIGMDGDFNAVLWNRGIAALNQRLCRLRPKSGVDIRFVAYFLPAPLKIINDLTFSTTVKHLSSADILRERIPLPPLEEQRRIADFLDAETARIDRAGSLQKRILATFEEREQAHLDIAIDDLVDECGSAPLRRFVWSVDQGVSPQCDAIPANKGEWGVLKVSCLRPGIFLPHENKRLPKDVAPHRESEVREGDLLITRANTPELVGSTAVVRKVRSKLLLSDKIFRVRLSSEMSPDFVATVARGSRIRALCASSSNGASQSMANIRFEEVKAWPMPLANTAQQQNFVARITENRRKIEEIKSRIQRQLELLAERRRALITAAVTGQFDVSTASGRGVTE